MYVCLQTLGGKVNSSSVCLAMITYFYHSGRTPIFYFFFAAGTDYESLLTTPTFTTETDRVCYDIQIIDDDIPEEQKLLNLVLATEDRSINLEPAIGSLTIKDDDGTLGP